MMSDADLIRDVLAGDGEVFGTLVTRYQQGVYALVWARVKDFASAEDLTQEAFITAYEQLPKLRDPATFPAWLRRIAVNRARMWLHRHSRREVKGDLGMVPAADREVTGLREEIARILISLPEEKRRVAILCYMDGVSRKDVARLFDVPEATLRKRLHDTKKLLQKRIVDAAEKNLEEHLLPRDFASRCICACRRAMDARRREVISMSKYKKKCDCGCLPQAKAKGKKNTESKSGKRGGK